MPILTIRGQNEELQLKCNIVWYEPQQHTYSSPDRRLTNDDSTGAQGTFITRWSGFIEFV